MSNAQLMPSAAPTVPRKTGKTHGVILIDENDSVLIDMRQRKMREFEPESVRFWLKYCRPENNLIDIGSYSGLYFILAKQRAAQCLAFEPNRYMSSRIEENCKLNGVDASKLSCAAVSNETGEKYFYLRAGNNYTSAASFTYNKNCEFFKVPVVTLDSLVDISVISEKIHCIKIDVENYEINVLKGAVELLKRDKPALIVEVLTDEHQQNIKMFLSDLGYKSFTLADKRNMLCG